MPRMDSFGLGQSKMLKCQRHNIEFDFSVFCPPRISPKQKEEQMENSSPNPSFSICDIRIQKQMSRSFAKSFPQKIVLPKLRPHCSATCLNTWKAKPQRKMSFPFSRKISPPPNQESKRHFSLGLPRLCEAVAERYERTRQFRFTTHAGRATSFVLE